MKYYQSVSVDEFEALGRVPLSDWQLQDQMPIIERFVVLMYDQTSSCNSVDDARRELFTQKGAINRVHTTHISNPSYSMQREQYIRQPMFGDNLY